MSPGVSRKGAVPIHPGRLTRLLADRKLSAASVSSAMGLSEATVRMWKYRRHMDPTYIPALAKELDMPPAAFEAELVVREVIPS